MMCGGVELTTVSRTVRENSTTEPPTLAIPICYLQAGRSVQEKYFVDLWSRAVFET